MRRGTKVGQAYVAIMADGSGLNDEIADQFDDVDYEKIGRDASGRYVKGWAKTRAGVKESLTGVEKDMSDSVKRMENSFRNSDAITTGVRKQLAKTFDSGALEPIMNRIGERLGVRTGEGFDKTIRESVLNSLEDIMETAARKGRGFNLVASPGGSGVDLPTETFDRLAASAKKAVDTIQKDYSRLFDEIEKREIAAAREYDKAWGEAHREEDRREKAIWKTRNESAKAYIKYLADLKRGKVDDRGNSVSRNGRDDGRDIGRFFGKGSRNNFFNAIGGAAGGVGSLTTGLFSLIGKIPIVDKMTTKLSGTFAQMSESGGMGASALGALGSSALAAAPAIAAVVAVMVVMVSVVGALLAILTSLVSVVASGLVGALAVGTAGFGAFGFAAGLATAAFMSMTDAQKKSLKEAFQPLRAEMVGIGQVMITQMVPAFKTWSTNLQEATALLAPVASVMGKTFADAGSIITKALSGPGFQNLSRALAVNLPGIISKMAAALGNFLDGAATRFALLLPLVNQFAGWLLKISTNFSAISTDAKKQNAFTDFVNRAVASLKSMWGVIRQTGGLIADILFNPQVQRAGIKMFNGIANAISSMRAGIARASKDGSLKKWLDDGIRFGSTLWSVIKSLFSVFASLYNSGVLTSITLSLRGFAEVMGWLADLINTTTSVVGPFLSAIGDAASAIQNMGRVAEIALGPVGNLIASMNNIKHGQMVRNRLPQIAPTPFIEPADSPTFSVPQLTSIGNTALAGTTSGGGRGGRGGRGGGWKNPYKAWAESLINDGPTISQQINKMIRQIASSSAKAARDAAKLISGADAKSALLGLGKDLRDAGNQMVEMAQQGVNDAARALADASSPRQAQAALKRLQQTRANLRQTKENLADYKRVAKMVERQAEVTIKNALDLANGLSVQNATLADYARAREMVAAKLEKAKQKLVDAIALRNDYNKAVSDAAKTFGALTTAQAQVVNGITQALTAGDITANLQDRLAKIQHFQQTLQLLLASGLSNDAYKQIVDAGVEQGTAYADALLAGGVGSIQQTNDLISQITGISDQLGSETANRLYQAGVDAAQGLVDGLNALDDELEAAAAKLGDLIAKTIKKELGIQSPSRVLRDMMSFVGDGASVGLDDQHGKVSAAGKRFSSAITGAIAVSPEVAAYQAAQTTAPAVSENDGRKFRDLVVQTPTEDPHAVAMEVLNEVTGRL